MDVLVYSARPYDEEFLTTANAGRHKLTFTRASLDAQTAASPASTRRSAFLSTTRPRRRCSNNWRAVEPA
jgi:hypothetical protein